MRFRRVGRLAAMVLPIVLWMACGQVYRPVVLPCSEGGLPGCPVETPPTPANFHTVFALSANVPDYPGGAMQVDVAGDSIIAETPTSDKSAPNLGDNPTHAAITPNDSKLFVAGAGSVFSGQTDTVVSFTPAFQFSGGSGFGTVTSISLPSQSSSISSISESGSLVTVTLAAPLNVIAGYSIVIAGAAIPGCTLPACNPLAYNGTFTLFSISGTTIQYTNAITGLAAGSGGTAAVPPQPVFLNSTENTAMYVANYNSNSVFAINTALHVVGKSATVGAHPVSLAETPVPLAGNSRKLYVANQGSNSVSSLNTLDLSSNTVNGFSGTNPVWVVARGDSQKVYVLTQGDGKLVTIDTATDTATTPDCSVTPTLCVGPGANFIFYDPRLNRLYVTNPVTSTVYVFSDTGGANDTPTLLKAISFGTTSGPCPSGCLPTSVTALPDGSRFYVASYQIVSPCPDTLAGATSACVIPGLTVFDANSFALEHPTAPTLTLLTNPPFASNQYAVPPLPACGPTVPGVPNPLYSPSATRFRVFTTASVDSSRVYVSICDAGVIADVDTTDANINNPGGGTPADTLVTDLPAAFSAGPAQGNGLPPNQNPIFLLNGQ